MVSVPPSQHSVPSRSHYVAVEQSVSTKKVLLVLVIGAAILAALHLVLFYITTTTDHGRLFGMVDRFNLDAENNIPTWFSTALFFTAAGYSLIIAKATAIRKLPYRRHWYALSVILLYLSLDEAGEVHETANLWAAHLFGKGWDLGFVVIRDWTSLALVAALIVALLFARFVFSLPAKTRNLFIISALVYVSGAVFVESLQYTSLRFSPDLFAWHVTVALEEGMEMLGLILAIYALGDYAQRAKMGITLRMKP